MPFKSEKQRKMTVGELVEMRMAALPHPRTTFGQTKDALCSLGIWDAAIYEGCVDNVLALVAMKQPFVDAGYKQGQRVRVIVLSNRDEED
jgi:hypothetical protein